MRRILLTAVGTMALALTAPAAALASHHHHHHKRHAHHAQVSFRHIGPAAAGAGGPGTTPSNGSTTTTPTTPSTPTTTEENAGKVTSYTGGVLTITLGNGSTVSGKVTINTRFQCISTTATQPPGDNDDQQGPGDDNGWGDDQGGDSNQQGGPPWQNGPQGGVGQWQQGGGDENGPDGPGDDDEAPISNEPPCDSSALVEGAIVRAAELRIAPGGTEFEWIKLVR